MSCDINCPKPEPEPEPELNETSINCTLFNDTSIDNFTMCINDSTENSTVTTSTATATTPKPVKADNADIKQNARVSSVKSSPQRGSMRKTGIKLTDLRGSHSGHRRNRLIGRSRWSRKNSVRQSSGSKRYENWIDLDFNPLQK